MNRRVGTAVERTQKGGASGRTRARAAACGEVREGDAAESELRGEYDHPKKHGGTSMGADIEERRAHRACPCVSHVT